MQDRSQCSRVVVRFCSVSFIGQGSDEESLLASVRTLFSESDVPVSEPSPSNSGDPLPGAPSCAQARSLLAEILQCLDVERVWGTGPLYQLLSSQDTACDSRSAELPKIATRRCGHRSEKMVAVTVPERHG
eukprot:scaffold71_cov247-Pinguiococcus_pyrenoidosus.AAC.42